MSTPYVGEIRMFAGNFAPRGFAFCDGQLLAVASNDALFSLLGTIYGGDGRTTFGLPDLRGRTPIHQGTGPGLTNRRIGTKGGSEKVTVTTPQLPAHKHDLKVENDVANDANPANNVLANTTARIYIDESPVPMAGAGIGNSNGGGQSHENMMPFLAIHYIIALIGVFPSRT